jgi:hypothetical protein
MATVRRPFSVRDTPRHSDRITLQDREGQVEASLIEHSKIRSGPKAQFSRFTFELDVGLDVILQYFVKKIFFAT